MTAPRLGDAFHLDLDGTVIAGGHATVQGGTDFAEGWYGYVSKDLRSVLGDPVKGPYSRRYCGTLKQCRKALRSSLKAALRAPNPYTGDPLCKDGDQWCYDAVRQRPTGGATQPLIHWINRPTFQQVNEIQKRLPR